MADNLSIYPDNCDYDDFSDWIELYNTSDVEVDLTHYYLTDNLNIPTKWAFPQGTIIQPNGFLVLRADGFDDTPGSVRLRDSYPWNENFITKYCHTNFKLAEEGEEIGLFHVSGSTVLPVDTFVYPTQLTDVSMGRALLTDYKTLYRFDQPTPGAANTTDAKLVEQFSTSVTFSIPGGFYSDAQTLHLTAADGEIYYTINGSVPTLEAIKYEGAIRLDSTTVIRARCIEKGRLIGKVTTHTYFINEKQRKLMVVAFATDSSFLFDEKSGIWTNSLKKREWPVSFEVFSPEGKQVVNVNGGMTLGSLSNFAMPQKPLQFKCGNKYGDDYIWYRFFKKSVATHRRLRLRQGGDAWDGNMIADGMLESICTGRMELGFQAYRPVVVFVNGEYYGIEALREQFDDQFFINHYGVDPTTKDEVRTTLVQNTGNSGNGGGFGNFREAWECVSGRWDDYDSLVSLVKSGSMNVESNYQQVASVIDINSCIDFFCAIVYGCQISWTHNQDLWKVAGGKWRWLIADFDRAFNRGNITYNIFNRSFFQDGGIIPNDTLFSALLANTDFRNHFAQRFSAHLNSTFHRDRLYGIIDSLHQLLLPEMEDHATRWSLHGGIQSVSEWEDELAGMKEFIDNRSEAVFQHLANATFNPQGMALLSLHISNKEHGDIFINDVGMCQGLDSLRFFKDIPLYIKAVPKPGFIFSGWDDGDGSTVKTVTFSSDTIVKGMFTKGKQYFVDTLIEHNVTLNQTDWPYAARGDITVKTGATLTIEKGVTLLMPQNAGILIKGRLVINGSEDAKVTIKENTFTGATGWGALSFENAVDTNLLNWVEISGTTLGNDPLTQRGGINGNNSNVVMDHLTMFNVGYPLYFEYGSTTIRNASITVDHICNGAVHIGRGKAVVENSTWISTGVTINTDAIDIKGVKNGVIRGNKIYNFNGFNSDAIDLGEAARDILVEDNIIYGSCDKGISVGGKSTATIVNNVIVDCDLGIGIKDDSSRARIDHTTFVRNRIGIAVYSKVFGRGGGSAEVTNCILASSRSRSFFKDRYSSISFSYCLSDIDILPGRENILENPGFTDMSENNFQLSGSSPCIGKGNPTPKKEIDGSTTDIGASYYYSPDDFPDSLVASYSSPPVIINEIMYNDSRLNNTDDWIELYNPSTEEIKLEHWKLTDKVDYTFWSANTDLHAIDSSDIYTFPHGTVISANGYLVVTVDSAAFKKINPDVANCIGTLPFGLNANETLLLYNESDSLVNAVAYRDTEPWPVSPNGFGPSLELIDATDLNFHQRNWDVSVKTGGSPGKANSVSPPPPSPLIPIAHFLAQNFPNPCKSRTTIRFELPYDERVAIDLFDISGRLIKRLFNDKLHAGYHSIDYNVSRYPSGIYLYRIRTTRFVKTKKMTVQ